MTYYSNYQYYKPLCCKSDDDDVPMIYHKRHICKSDDDDVPMISRERHIQSVRRAPQEHYQDSSNFVFQVESEDETEEGEEDDEFTNYPHETSQVVLQDLLTLEPKATENSDLKDLDYENSEFEDYDFEESIEEEVEEILVMHDLEVVESAATSSTLEVHKTNVSYPDSYAIVDYDADIKELQELLGISDQGLDELMKNGVRDDLILEAEFETLHRANGTQVQTRIGGAELDVPSIKESKSGCISHSLPCNCECILLIEPKPPNSCISGFQDSLLVKDVDELKFDMDRGILNKSESSKSLAFHTNLANYSLLDEPGVVENSGLLFLVVAREESTMRNCTFMWLLDKSLRDNWLVVVIIWEKIYINRKTKDDFLPCEYDWKGIGVVILDPP